MKYLKLFESRKYDTIEISQDEVDNLLSDEEGNEMCVPFTDKEIDDLRKLFAIKGMKITPELTINFHKNKNGSKGHVFRIVSTKSSPSLYFDIVKLEDDWYVLEVQYYENKKDDYMTTKYYKCDQLDGLKEVISEYIGSIPDNTKFSTEQLKKVRRDRLRNQINAKIKAMTNDQLEELLKKI